ncbi:Bifunctional inhibitor/lipid-transfer protein/seed storage 2S albumin superfamily protein [Rhynchospora pubera]|uniref:Bifunctional inhibitor/lipid-transfer protein/seed storage 2S albumin superfamily protein n=1 Tax=Rhynchospora pubera TaxID=906938 RepID=A0AAV8H6P6_9POAL|nr:Bifunctional inhibitor/lipid-transfer protein/seed storage 2S albumin superfamily protein [Rhynchospora pubera]
MATLRPLLISLASMCLVLMVNSDFAADRAECTDQLMGLATCITYVEGTTTAKNPTPDCCAGFKQVVGKSLKCMCILVKDRDEPELGIKINVSLALQLPHKCNVPTNISDCPRLLKLPKDSAETKMYEQFAKELEDNSTPTSTPNSSTGKEKGKPSTESAVSTSTQSNGAERNQMTGYKMIRATWIFQLVLPFLYLFHV